MLKEEAKNKKNPSQILATIGYGNFIILDDYQVDWAVLKVHKVTEALEKSLIFCFTYILMCGD